MWLTNYAMPVLARSPVAAAAAGLVALSLWGLAGGGSPSLLPSAALAQGADTRVVVLRLSDGEVTGDHVVGAGRRAVLRLRRGDSVELRWTVDRATALHLHGYGVETRATVDGGAVMTFVAGATGRFPIEARDLGDRTVLYVEVLPR